MNLNELMSEGKMRFLERKNKDPKVEVIRLQNTGRYEEAIKIYEEILEKTPEDRDTWYHKAWCFNRMGRFEEQILCYDKAIDLFSKKHTSKTRLSLKIITETSSRLCMTCIVLKKPLSAPTLS
jgi:tetratricopeptide (TPR) repeat protein